MSSGDLESIVRKAKMRNDEWKQVVLYADRHSRIASVEADLIMKKYIKDNKKHITHVIDMGDGIDNPFMSVYAVDPHFKQSAQEEFDEYAEHLAELDKIVPDAFKILIAGNHDKTRLDNTKKMNRGMASLRNLQYESVLKEALAGCGANLDRFKLVDPAYTLKLTRSNSALFTHGDPRIDPNVKGGVTGARRTAEMYPFDGDIYMGHTHQHSLVPRRYDGKHLAILGGMFDTKKMKKLYVSYHPYETGFGVIKYNKKRDLRVFQYIPIIKGRAMIDGTEYYTE